MIRLDIKSVVDSALDKVMEQLQVTNNPQLTRLPHDFDNFAEKTTPDNNDCLLVEDSQADGIKKRVKISSLPGGGATAWGQITGTLGSQTDLANSLAGKAPTSHGHAEADVTGLITDLAGKAASTHGHAEADVTGLVTDLAGKAAASHNHVATDINSGTLDGDRLPATSTTKKGGVPATGTPSGKFLKDDGNWATAGGAGTPSDSVVTETAFGQSSIAGASANYSRGDHTHGSPADPVPTHATLGTGIHGVGTSTVESVSGSQGKVDTHKIVTASVHNFDASGNAPAQTHDNTKHSATYALDSALSSHAGAAAPHSGHEATANKGAVSGYSPLDAAQKVPTVNLGGAGAGAGNYLCGDQTWNTPPGASEIAQSNRLPAGDVTIAANCSAVVVGDFEIAAGYMLELASNSVMEIS
jgi:hypothetical protein